MANNNNTFKVARGKRNAKSASYGELFYDRVSQKLYIGDNIGDGTNPSKWIPIGGFNNIVLIQKDATALPTTGYDTGDAYIIADTLTDEQIAALPAATSGNIKPGDLVICIGDDNGTPIWYDIDAGAVLAKDVVYDTSNAQIANEHGTETAQDALDYLFNNKAQPGGNISDLTATAGVYELTKGEFYVFDIPTGDITVSVGGTETTFTDVHKGSYIYVTDDGPQIVAGGVSDAENLDFAFTKKRENLTDELYGVGADATFDKGIANVQDALDDLIQTKADLLANGKIPISQIPSTLVGALQYKGIATIGTELEDKKAYTADTFAAACAALIGWEEDTDKSSTADTAFDNGDYVIINGVGEITIDGITFNSGDWAIYNEGKFDLLNASGAVDNINGTKGSVTIEGSTRVVNTHETEVITIEADPDTNTITIDAPNVAVIPEEGLEDYEIPVGTANNGIVGSGIKLTPDELNNGNTSVQLPKDNGNMVVAGAEDGTGNIIPKFDPDANGAKLIDSNIEDNGEKVKIDTTFEIDYTNKKIGVYDDDAAKMEYYQFDGHANHGPQPNGANPAHPLVLIDDASVIDCGVWGE